MPPATSPTSLKILMVTPEAVPFAKTGGLADVAGVLPRELVRLGHDVRLVIPGYASIDRQTHGFTDWIRLPVPTHRGPVRATIERGLLPLGFGEPDEGAGVPVFAVRHGAYFAREGLYQQGGTDYPDNLERFSFFCRAAMELAKMLASGVHQDEVTAGGVGSGDGWTEEAKGTPKAMPKEMPWIPDILHMHDWQTALCPVYLRTLYADVLELGRLRSLFTIHNLGYQGIFPHTDFPLTGLGPELFTPAGFEYYGSLNLLKGGLLYADFLNTVSPTYSREIQGREFGFGLEGVIAQQRDRLRGIVNGIDVETWNPAADPYLTRHYSVADLSGKYECKAALQAELKLPTRDVPVLGVVSRFAEQKGIDLIAEILPELMELDLQVVILGTGDREYEARFRTLQTQHPIKLGVHVGFDEGLAHRVEAGSDMFLMPSRYEPCGLSQQYSLRYGTVPIVSSTGGLADTVVPYSPRAVKEGRATGFAFGPASPQGLLLAIMLALRVYERREEWTGLMRAGMLTDVSWTRSARAYVEVYQEALSHPRKGLPGTQMITPRQRS
jgi:starch synthase